MKFQHLILPLVLWLLVGACFLFFVPTSPLIIGCLVIFLSCAIYFSLRILTRSGLPLIVTCCVSLFLFSSVLSGFNLINLMLIVAIGTLIFLLTTSH